MVAFAAELAQECSQQESLARLSFVPLDPHEHSLGHAHVLHSKDTLLILSV